MRCRIVNRHAIDGRHSLQRHRFACVAICLNIWAAAVSDNRSRKLHMDLVSAPSSILTARLRFDRYFAGRYYLRLDLFATKGPVVYG